MAIEYHTKENKSLFYRFMKSVNSKKTYFWLGERDANNGDRLILKGVQRILRETGCELVDSPEAAEQILMNGGGRFQDIWPKAFEQIAYFRRKYPLLPLIMAPQIFRIGKVNFKEICEISRSPLMLFARDSISLKSLQDSNLGAHCKVDISQDPAFELIGSEFIRNLIESSSEKHVLIAMRKDECGPAKILSRTHGMWLPKKVRRPLSWVRDRLVARISGNTIEKIIKDEKGAKKLPRIYRDVSSSVSYEKFVKVIRDAGLIITDRLHISILGYLLNKRVVLVWRPGPLGDKLKGVYDFSMSGADSRTSLYMLKDSK
ncbi:MAG: polysaccharide pyruvyl transferase family protein [Sedimentisphaerales bacterium]|nr:polysaccharide pyruvyl transferase family protein [Sedimentisphaerales bacterium]